MPSRRATRAFRVPLAAAGRQVRLVCGLLVCGLVAACGEAPPTAPRFEDSTAVAGLEIDSPSFGAVFSDLDGDGDDDLLVSRHAEGPALFLNRGDGRFETATRLLPTTRGDRHGLTAVDLDGDGDRDVVLACGGADGVGEGCPAAVFRNLLVEEGSLRFERLWGAFDPPPPTRHRSRGFLPVASADGTRVDLYLAGLKRPGFPNLYYRNTGEGLALEQADARWLDQELSSEGQDAFFDADRDGFRDLLVLGRGAAQLLRARAGGLTPVGSGLEVARRPRCAAVADFDNDGAPDLFLGAGVPSSGSDNVSFDGSRLHAFASDRSEAAQAGPGRDRRDGLRFRIRGTSLRLDLAVKEGILPDDPSRVFLGARHRHPPSLDAAIDAAEAAGEPALEVAGTYLWHDAAADRWTLLWLYPEGEARSEKRATVLAEGIADVEPLDFETFPKPPPAVDQVFLNAGGGIFEPLEGARLEHGLVTVSCVAVDLDNDGLVDVAGIRHGEPAAPNGDPFVLLNRGPEGFEEVVPSPLANPEDDLYRADQLIYGFVDGDGLADLFWLNGEGLKPGNEGPFKLFRNTTATNNHWVLLELEGSRSNLDALGAQVELLTTAGELLGYRELGWGFHRAQSSHKLHFGLGRRGATVWARVRWPSGATSEHEVPADAVTRIVEPPL